MKWDKGIFNGSCGYIRYNGIKLATSDELRCNGIWFDTRLVVTTDSVRIAFPNLTDAGLSTWIPVKSTHKIFKKRWNKYQSDFRSSTFYILVHLKQYEASAKITHTLSRKTRAPTCELQNQVAQGRKLVNAGVQHVGLETLRHRHRRASLWSWYLLQERVTASGDLYRKVSCFANVCKPL
jgi:hypothetical protein